MLAGDQMVLFSRQVVAGGDAATEGGETVATLIDRYVQRDNRGPNNLRTLLEMVAPRDDESQSDLAAVRIGGGP